MIKWFITDFRKVNLYGDAMCIDEKTTKYEFRGKRLDVKLCGIIWITYRCFFKN